MKIQKRIENRLSNKYAIDPLTIIIIVKALQILVPYIIEWLKKLFNDDGLEFGGGGFDPGTTARRFKNAIKNHLSWYQRLVLKYRYRKMIKSYGATIGTTDLFNAINKEIVFSDLLEITDLIEEYN